MLRTIMAIVAAGAITASCADAFAWGGRRGGGGGDGATSRSAASSSSSLEYSSEPYSSVPEPGTIVLLASGVAGVVLWVRRRK
jgi:hypothetical protein